MGQVSPPPPFCVYHELVGCHAGFYDDVNARACWRDKGMNKYCMILVGLIGAIDRSEGNDCRWVTSAAPAHAMQGQGRLSLPPSSKGEFFKASVAKVEGI